MRTFVPEKRPGVVCGVLVLALLALGAAPSDPATAEEGGIESCAALEELNEIQSLIRKYECARAESLARDLLARFEAEHGGTSVQTACVLDLLVESLWRGGRAAISDARGLADRAVATKKRLFGDVHPEVAASLRNLGQILEESGDTGGAEPIYGRVIALREEIHGSDALEVTLARTDLANLYLILERYDEARDQYESILEIQQRADEPLEAARTLQNLGIVLQAVGDYEGARSRYERALRARREVYRGDHVQVAWTLNALGELLRETGEYEQARLRHEEALGIRERLLPPDHDQVAWSLLNLANLSRDTGDYEQARSYYARALGIEERVHGKHHLHVAKVLHNQAWLLVLTGDRTRARALYEKVLGIRRKAPGDDGAGVATTLSDLASLLVAMGDLAGAEARYRESMRIVRDTLGDEDVDYARDLKGLARVRSAQGRLDDATSLLGRAIGIEVNAFGERHATVVESFNDLADLRLRAGDLAQARRDYERALGIGEEALGPVHPLVGRTLGGIGRVLARLGEPDAALGAALRAEEIGREHLLPALRTLPERQALRYAEVRVSGLDLALSIAAGDEARGAVRRGWDALIRSRALVLDGMASRRRSIVGSDDPQVIELAASLARASGLLAYWTVRGPSPHQSTKRYLSLLDALSVEKERIEAELAARSSSYRKKRVGLRIGLAEVAGSLPPATALVAFATYDRHPVAGGSARRGEDARTTPESAAAGASEAVRSYIAFALAPGSSEPQAIPLGPASEIEDLIRRWLDGVRKPPARSDASAKEAEARLRREGDRLRRRVWDPVAASLGDVERVFVVPDGALSLLNLYGLPADPGKYLIETGPTIHYLSAERDVVAARAERVPGNGLLAVGGPDFGNVEAPTVASPGPGGSGGSGAPAGRTMRASGPPLSECTSFQQIRFSQLSGALDEAREVAGLWRDHAAPSRRGEVRGAASGGDAEVVLLSGASATERAFKSRAAGRRVVHLSTHGFFLGGECPSLLDGTRGIGRVRPARVQAPLPTLAGENPLLLSGLALAGANRREEARPGEEDGVLTAEEVAAMDLSGVEWAVLSACDTGLGEVAAGEGVLGLRRAFAVAGAGAVIMSLWPVSERSAREWMGDLYRGRLVERLGTADAVRRASRRALQRLRDENRHGHPHYWAVFVAAGDWR